MKNIIEGYKQIHDSIHGYIKISNIACEIIDTIEFQRLRYLHQLGTCNYVFPNATHTRFEHSIGTYYLADRMLRGIKQNSDISMINQYMDEISELEEYYNNKRESESLDKLDKYVCELVKISALCHDLGHGPFSHVFDDIFLQHHMKESNNKMKYHENRSGMILEHIIRSNEMLSKIIAPSELKFMKKLINPGSNDKHFIYQIVSNKLNNIDVDKFDYITRDTKMLGLNFGMDYTRLVDDVIVINNIICYPEQMCYEIVGMFKTRYRLHKQIYCHKIVIAIQYMISEIMHLLEPIMKFTESIESIDKFIKLTDSYIISSISFLYENRNNYPYEQKHLIKKAHHIWHKINNRKLYRFIDIIISDKKLYPELSDIIQLDPEDYLIHSSKIGLVSGSIGNPLDNIYLYKNKNKHILHKIKKENISVILPTLYQEYIYMVYLKNRNDIEKERYLTKLLEEIDNNI
jgi:HD superfamily phosphohydrolase